MNIDFIFSRQNISTSESKRLGKGAIEFNIVVCRLTIAVDIKPNLFDKFVYVRRRTR